MGQEKNSLFHKPLIANGSKSPSAPVSSGQAHHVPNFLESKNQQDSQKPLLHGRSQVSVHELKKTLEKNPKVRRALAQKLGKKPYSREVEAAIKEMESEIPRNITQDGFISNLELKSMYDSRHSGLKEYWDEKHERQKMSEGGITKEEISELERRKTVRSFLKNLFGFGKK